MSQTNAIILRIKADRAKVFERLFKKHQYPNWKKHYAKGGMLAASLTRVAYEDKPTVILEGTGGWADRIRGVAYKGKHLDEVGINELHFAKTPAEAVDLALSLAPGAETGKAVEREFRS